MTKQLLKSPGSRLKYYSDHSLFKELKAAQLLPLVLWPQDNACTVCAISNVMLCYLNTITTRFFFYIIVFSMFLDWGFLWCHWPDPHEKPGELIPVHLQEDFRLPVALWPQEREQGGCRPAIRLRGELHKPETIRSTNRATHKCTPTLVCSHISILNTYIFTRIRARTHWPVQVLMLPFVRIPAGLHTSKWSHTYTHNFTHKGAINLGRADEKGSRGHGESVRVGVAVTVTGLGGLARLVM